MCIVRLAFDLEEFQFVAIKSLFQELSELDDYQRRFSREQSIYKRLHHPHIVSLVDAVDSGSNTYIALEYVSGSPLTDYVKGRLTRLPVGRVLRYLGDLADALVAVHEARIIHRDIKPANVILDQDGCVKLLDFGVAAADDGIVETETGVMVGTRCYASPEQNQGQDVGPASDLWSLGVTFWEVLSGRKLFDERAGRAIAEAQYQRDIEPPSIHNDEVPPELDELILRLLDSNRRTRLSSAADVREEVERIRRRYLSTREAHAPDLRFECAHIALHRMMAGDLNGAEAVLADAPGGSDDGAVQFLLGKLAWRRGLRFRALDYVRRAVALTPLELLYRADLARILLSFNMFNQAARVVAEARRLGENSNVLQALAKLLDQGRKYLSERRVKGAAIDESESTDDVVVKEERARQAVETASTIQSSVGRMQVLVAEGAYREAVELWDSISEAEKRSREMAVLGTTALHGLAQSLIDEGTFSEGLQVLRRTLRCLAVSTHGAASPDGDAAVEGGLVVGGGEAVGGTSTVGDTGAADVVDKLASVAEVVATVSAVISARAEMLRHESVDDAVTIVEEWHGLVEGHGFHSAELDGLFGSLLFERGRVGIALAEDCALALALGRTAVVDDEPEQIADRAYVDLTRARQLGAKGVEPHQACAGSVRAELRFSLVQRLATQVRETLVIAADALENGAWSTAIEVLTRARELHVVGRPHVIDRLLVDAHALQARAMVEAALLDLHEGIIDRRALGTSIAVARQSLVDVEPIDSDNYTLEACRRRFGEIEQLTGCAMPLRALELVAAAEDAAARTGWDEALSSLLDCFEALPKDGAPLFLRRQLAMVLTNRAEACAARAWTGARQESRSLLEGALQDLADAAFFHGDGALIAKARARVERQLEKLSS